MPIKYPVVNMVNVDTEVNQAYIRVNVRTESIYIIYRCFVIFWKIRKASTCIYMNGIYR